MRRSLNDAVLVIFIMTSNALCVAGTGKASPSGVIRVETINSNSAPVELLSAHIFDPAERVPGNTMDSFFPSVREANDQLRQAGQLRFGTEIQNNSDKDIVAVECLWEAYNAFEEKEAEVELSFEFKKPLRPGKKGKGLNEASRLSDNVSRYRVSVSRLKFSDGTVWPETVENNDQNPDEE